VAHPQAEALAAAFISHFWSANREIKWTAVEEEASLWLAPDVVLVGRVDARGVTPDGRAFFADWKTASSGKLRFKDATKSQWRMSPQALTYGVLSPGVHDFTVRWAFKTEPPACDHEWYTFTDAETAWWRSELLGFAEEIRTLRNPENRPTMRVNWPTNLNNCTKYGERYRCPFRDRGCWALDFGHVPDGMHPRESSHLAIENTLRAEKGDIVVLDASRVSDFISCRELYRKLWERSPNPGQGWGLQEESEALTVGTDFHDIIHQHILGIMEEQNGRAK
jgi:hypothetical protein